MPLSPATLRRKMNEFRAGAANYNRVLNLIRQRERLARNRERLLQESERTANKAENARRALGRYTEGTPMFERYARQSQSLNNQANRLYTQHAEANRQLRRVTNQINPIIRRPGQITVGDRQIARFLARLNRMHESLLSHAIQRAYLAPGGMYSRKLVRNVQRQNAARKIQSAWRRRAL
jgi:seryl-tRNA synthetase